jgi:hypothetical protein
VHVLEHLADLTGVLGVSAGVMSTVTGGDIDANGRRALIRRYGFAYEFVLPDGEPFDAIFQQQPRSLGLAGEVQGEGICYASDGGDIYTTSEVVVLSGLPIGPARCPVYRTPWQVANVRAEPAWPVAAMIRWDTRSPLNSQADFGTSTEYDRQISASEPVGSHLLALSDLSRSTRYYYRVTSGSQAFPPPAEAAHWFFTTPATVRPDLDGDGDVDQEDFGLFQKCLTGSDVPQTRPECRAARLDADDDVDALDFAALHACLSGPNQVAHPLCMPWP